MFLGPTPSDLLSGCLLLLVSWIVAIENFYLTGQTNRAMCPTSTNSQEPHCDRQDKLITATIVSRNKTVSCLRQFWPPLQTRLALPPQWDCSSFLIIITVASSFFTSCIQAFLSSSRSLLATFVLSFCCTFIPLS